ncbi:hypothetical protein [Blastococcus deserti]|uniref:SnoaL-like protein n=1 Tax=Blastococcus deserti TaxID=2259033 RepID=A0ABW4XEY7_9ACTN
MRAAAAWVEALVQGDSDTARLMLCTGGLDAFPDGQALQAEFDRVAGGGETAPSIVGVERRGDRDRVLFVGRDASDGPVAFRVSVLVAPYGRSICGFSAA